MRPGSIWVLASLLASGCFLDRSGIVGGVDGGPPRDGGYDSGIRIDAGDCTMMGPDDDCDGVDDDCDGFADDEFPRTPCESPADSDLCMDDEQTCPSGSPTCVDVADPTVGPDVCDNEDNDCDPTTDDGSADLVTPLECDGPDADDCAEGTYDSCVSGLLVCSDATGDTVDTDCDGVDDDCDGLVDDEAAANCDSACDQHIGPDGHSYLFCRDTRTWSEANGDCGGGYDLARIDSPEENALLAMWAAMHSTTDYWIGASDNTTEGEWVWSDGSALGYANWKTGEPNNDLFATDNPGDEDCAELDPDQPGAMGTAGGWNDESCAVDNNHICEAAP